MMNWGSVGGDCFELRVSALNFGIREALSYIFVTKCLHVCVSLVYVLKTYKEANNMCF